MVFDVSSVALIRNKHYTSTDEIRCNVKGDLAYSPLNACFAFSDKATPLLA
jgi:hypothetical protein